MTSYGMSDGFKMGVPSVGEDDPVFFMFKTFHYRIHAFEYRFRTVKCDMLCHVNGCVVFLYKFTEYSDFFFLWFWQVKC